MPDTDAYLAIWHMQKWYMQYVRHVHVRVYCVCVCVCILPLYVRVYYYD